MNTNEHRSSRFDVKKAVRFLRLALCLCLCLTMVMANVGVAYATGTTQPASTGIDAIEDVITLAADELYNIIRAVVIPIIIPFLAWAGLQFLIGGTRGVEKARNIVFGSFAAIIFVVFAPVIANQVGEWFAPFGGDGIENYNPLD